MLILPPGHADALQRAPRIAGRERAIVGGVAALAAALLVVVVLSIGSSGHTTGGGCVDVKFPIAIGGEEIYECGAKARALCASAGQRPSEVEAKAVAEQCRKAGLRVG